MSGIALCREALRCLTRDEISEAEEHRGPPQPHPSGPPPGAMMASSANPKLPPGDPPGRCRREVGRCIGRKRLAAAPTMETILEMPSLKLVSLPARDSRHRRATHRQAEAAAYGGNVSVEIIGGAEVASVDARVILGISNANTEATCRGTLTEQ